MKDMVKFLSPKLEMCNTFACDGCRYPPGKNPIINLILQKFINPVLINHASMVKDSQPARAPVISNNNVNRKYKTLR